MTLYYIGLACLVFALAWVAPEWFAQASAGPAASASLERGLSEYVSNQGAAELPLRKIYLPALLFSLVSALLLMLPVSWAYMSARIRSGFDQSMVQAMLILPIAVAGIVMIVYDSIALAFSLAGIVAAVRFRNALRDTADALYIFAAIGVGLACGVGEVETAAAMSMFFNYVVLTLWHCDYGVCPQTGPQAQLSSGHLLNRVGATPGVGALEKSQRKKGKKKKKRKQPTEQEATGAESADDERMTNPSPSLPPADVGPSGQAPASPAPESSRTPE